MVRTEQGKIMGANRKEIVLSINRPPPFEKKKGNGKDRQLSR